MKTLIIFKSVQYGNTQKVASAMAAELGADLKQPSEVAAADWHTYDLIGFGSGIYNIGHHQEIRSLVRQMPRLPGKNVFVFSTSGTGSREFSRVLISQLSGKGCRVVDDFACKGFDTFGPNKLVGGIAKGHPDAADIEAARHFARELKNRLAGD